MARTVVVVVLLVAATAIVPVALGADSPASKVSKERLEQAIANLEKLAGDTVDTNGTPGLAIAIVFRDEIVVKKGFGVREAGQPEKIDENTVFQVASMSKPITSTVLARLVGQGKISWDDRVSDLDPPFVMYAPYVTRELRLRDLLCHRSGLPDHAGDLLEDMGYPRDEILRRLRYQPPSSSFRAGYAYTNFGYSEAAYAAAKSLGAEWDELAAATLFEPLSMKSTSYRFSDYAKSKNRALLHVLVDGKWTAKHTRQPDAQAPAGGVSSTITDLAQWLRLQLAGGRFAGEQLVAESALAETHTPQIVTGFSPEQGRVASYGLGWNVIDQRGGLIVVNHSGAFDLGVRTEVAMIPSLELGIVVLSNGGPNGVPEGLIESFFDWVLDGKLQRDWLQFANEKFAEDVAQSLSATSDFSKPPLDRNPPLESSAYVGKYHNDYFGTIEIVDRKPGLALGLGPELKPFELQHWNRDVFSFQPEGEMAGGRSGVIFSVGPDGRADSVEIESLNLNGLGRFKRQP